MFKNYKNIFALAAAGIIAQSASAYEYSHTTTGESTETFPSFDLSTASIASGEDVTINYTVAKTMNGEKEGETPANGKTFLKISDAATFGNFVYNLNVETSKLWAEDFFRSENALTVDSFTLNLVSCKTWHPYNNLSLGSSLTVKNDFLFQDYRNWQYSRLKFGGTTVNIGGNLIVSGKDGANTFNNVELQLGDSSVFNVGGVVDIRTISTPENMREVYFCLGGSYTKSVNRTFGGLNIANMYNKTKMELLYLNSADGGSTNLTLTNADKSEFVGALTTRIKYDSQAGTYGDMIDNKLDITMAATNPLAGRQIFRFTDVGENYDTNDSSWMGYRMTNAKTALRNIVVKSGRLEISMYEGMVAESLSLEGQYGAFSAAGATTDNNVGDANFNSISYTSGALYFDFAKIDDNIDADYINVNGKFTSNSADKVIFGLNITAQDLETWGYGAIEIDIMSYATDGSITVDDIQLLLRDDTLRAKLNSVQENGKTILSVSVAAVPEPATVAAILGAAALAFAAIRRRK